MSSRATRSLAFLPRSVLGAPVTGTLMPALPIARHLWQEYHKDAATGAYDGGTKDDQRVVENVDASGQLQSKERLHLCFLEKAIATIDASVAAGATLFMRWWIEDASGATVREHPWFSQANYDANKRRARLTSGKQGWLWDGRRGKRKPVFVAAGTYFSRIEVKNAAGTTVQRSEQPIELEGNPYRIFILGQPKSDAEMRAEFKRYDRWLSDSGYRFPRDCWIKVYRGIDVSQWNTIWQGDGSGQEGHVVFLAHGAIEATDASLKRHPPAGSIATPHNREFKGWIRTNPHGESGKADRIQIQDVGGSDIALRNPGGPRPINPSTGSDYKDGVQAHAGHPWPASHRYPDAGDHNDWCSNGMSLGCTTISRPVQGSRVAEARGVHSDESQFGDWGSHYEAGDLARSTPVFANKQSKRARPDDARLADDHASPSLSPPLDSTTQGAAPQSRQEPLHLQPTMQRGVFGGFLPNEVPRSSDHAADEPQNEPPGHPPLRIRMVMQEPRADSMYFVYHRAVVFGHEVEVMDSTHYRLSAWIPHKVIRVWNGNPRNLMVAGQCKIAWYIERRTDGAAPAVVHRFNGTSSNPPGYVNLPNDYLGQANKVWDAAREAVGTYWAVFKFRLRLNPDGGASKDAWVAQSSMQDLFSDSAAILADEEIVREGGHRYLVGRSEFSFAHRGAAASTLIDL